MKTEAQLHAENETLKRLLSRIIHLYGLEVQLRLQAQGYAGSALLDRKNRELESIIARYELPEPTHG